MSCNCKEPSKEQCERDLQISVNAKEYDDLKAALEAKDSKIDNLNASLDAANDRARVYKEKWNLAQVALEQQQQQLHGKDVEIAELSSEIERKDGIIRELLTALNHSCYLYKLEGYCDKCPSAAKRLCKAVSKAEQELK